MKHVTALHETEAVLWHTLLQITGQRDPATHFPTPSSCLILDDFNVNLKKKITSPLRDTFSPNQNTCDWGTMEPIFGFDLLFTISYNSDIILPCLLCVLVVTLPRGGAIFHLHPIRKAWRNTATLYTCSLWCLCQLWWLKKHILFLGCNPVFYPEF